MARTRAEDYDERRTAIVERAAELFADKGFDGASLSDLARACNVSKSLIYHYFPSKEDILFEVMEDHIHVLVEGARRTMREAVAAPAPEKLRLLTHTFMRLYAGAAARHRVLLNELSRLQESQRDQIRREQRELIAIVAGVLAEMRPDTPAHLRTPAAMMYFGMINWTHTWFDPKGEVSADEIADLAAETVLAGLGPPARIF